MGQLIMMGALILISLVAVIASKYVHQEMEDTPSVDPGFSANGAVEVASETEFRGPMTAHEFVNRIKRSPKKNKKKNKSSEESDESDESKESEESEESSEETSGDGTDDTEEDDYAYD